jgi:hypothetical protein
MSPAWGEINTRQGIMPIYLIIYFVSDSHVLWTWNRMLERTTEIWRRDG